MEGAALEVAFVAVVAFLAGAAFFSGLAAAGLDFAAVVCGAVSVVLEAVAAGAAAFAFTAFFVFGVGGVVFLVAILILSLRGVCGFAGRGKHRPADGGNIYRLSDLLQSFNRSYAPGNGIVSNSSGGIAGDDKHLTAHLAIVLARVWR
jgi:hypothetical protein